MFDTVFQVNLRIKDMSDQRQLRNNTPLGEINHVNYLSDNIGALYLSTEYSDIRLKVEDKTFEAHKVILAARSEYFR